MGLFDGIEKLINEHGSATILKERIALANDKYAALERKLSDAESRINQLEAEKQGIEFDYYKLKDRVQNLEQQIVERHGQRMEDVREKLLVIRFLHCDSLHNHVFHTGESKCLILRSPVIEVVMF